MNPKIEEMLNEYIEDGDFIGTVSDEAIEKAEEVLKVKFPRDYRKFVKHYGSGGICGVDILNIEGTGSDRHYLRSNIKHLPLKRGVIWLIICLLQDFFYLEIEEALLTIYTASLD
ncbi:SMI1/KNR4 family protein [Alkalihalophilus pseudofirmus]|uniref:SMI1/KNR4 family protein n=1 Tax=Alkalihalophilus pseudofirmus TaxID=79885 RepID=UPI00259BB60C|nr:SMI1/KNR4 family protein [Alkalihalophilus pseudofirmus]WEG18955.1 SMI1/KNR4 family protein [Alkalihalophilus pseudofirmus]